MADQDNGPSSEEPQETPGEQVSETSSEPTPSSEDQVDQPSPVERPLPDGAVALTDDDGEIPDSSDSGMQQPNRRRRRRHLFLACKAPFLLFFVWGKMLHVFFF